MSSKTLNTLNHRHLGYREQVDACNSLRPKAHTVSIRAGARHREIAGRALIAAIKADMLDNKKADAKAIAKLRAAAAKAKAKAKAEHAKKAAKKAVKRVVPAARRLGSDANPVSKKAISPAPAAEV